MGVFLFLILSKIEVGFAMLNLVTKCYYLINKQTSMDKELKQSLSQISSQFKDIDSKLEKMDDRFVKVENKIDTKVDGAVDSLARLIATAIAEPLERHLAKTRDYPTVRKDVALLKHDVAKIKLKLKIRT